MIIQASSFPRMHLQFTNLAQFRQYCFLEALLNESQRSGCFIDSSRLFSCRSHSVMGFASRGCSRSTRPQFTSHKDFHLEVRVGNQYAFILYREKLRNPSPNLTRQIYRLRSVRRSRIPSRHSLLITQPLGFVDPKWMIGLEICMSDHSRSLHLLIAQFLIHPPSTSHRESI